jgi:hypothetical protein
MSKKHQFEIRRVKFQDGLDTPMICGRCGLEVVGKVRMLSKTDNPDGSTTYRFTVACDELLFIGDCSPPPKGILSQ